MTESTVSVLNCKVPNLTDRGIENWKMCAVKQIKICSEYRNMVLEASVGLSCKPVIRPAASAQVPDKPALALVTMSRYSPQILICVILWCFYPKPVLAYGYCRCLHLCVRACVSVCVYPIAKKIPPPPHLWSRCQTRSYRAYQVTQTPLLSNPLMVCHECQICLRFHWILKVILEMAFSAHYT